MSSYRLTIEIRQIILYLLFREDLYYLLRCKSLRRGLKEEEIQYKKSRGETKKHYYRCL